MARQVIYTQGTVVRTEPLYGRKQNVVGQRVWYEVALPDGAIDVQYFEAVGQEYYAGEIISVKIIVNNPNDLTNAGYLFRPRKA